MNQYYKQYQWSNIFAMIDNLRKDPSVCTLDFPQRLVVISGATSGIGYAAARKYASHGADLLMINRNEEKSAEVCAALRHEFNTNCDYIIADFSRLQDVHRVSQQLNAIQRDIDVLIHNAGVYNTQRIMTSDNLEAVFQTNYLSTFILNYALREKFKNQGSGRILFVNSEAHRFAVWGLDMDDLSWENQRYSGYKSYGSAKLAQLLSMIKFAQYFKDSGVTINAMHPGNVRTNSGQNNGRLYKIFKRVVIDRSARSAEMSAEALYYLGVSPAVQNITGKFFNLTTQEEPAPPALDAAAAEKLWQLSFILGGINEY